MRFSLGTLLVVTAFVAVILVGFRSSGASGIGLAGGVVAVIWFTLSRTTTSSLYPINRQRMTVVDLVTILVTCFVFYGLTLPAVTSSHRRRSIPATPGPSTPITNSESVNIDSEWAKDDE